MEVIIQSDPAAAAKLAADIVTALVRSRPNAVLGLATGSTPLGLYRQLVERYRAGEIDFGQVTTFNLDEYCGLSGDHPGSYRTFMRQHFFDHVNIPQKNIHLPDGMTTDVPAFCEAYEDAIRKAGGIDLQVLGIGTNGHIGFNEPSSSLASRTRIKTLSAETIRANAKFFESEEKIPRHVLTMGVGTILESRSCLMMAFGSNKARAVAQMVEGPITAMVPASVLQMHQRTWLLVDEPAASQLSLREYYDWVYSNKPDWQAGAGHPVRQLTTPRSGETNNPD